MSRDADEVSTGPTPEELAEFKEAMEDTEGDYDPEPVSSEEEPTPSDSDDSQAAAPAQDEPTGATPATDEPREDDQQPSSEDPRWLKTHTFKGETKTLKQWHDEGLLETIFTNANQSSHLQEKHRKQLEEQKAREEAQRLATSQPQQLTLEQQAKVSEKLRDTYMPDMKAMADAGIIEKEIVEDAPKLVALLMHKFGAFEKKAKIYDGFLSTIHQERTQIAAARQEEEGVNLIVKAVDDVAAIGEEYAGLTDPDHRQEFYNWLGSENNPMAAADDATSRRLIQNGIMLQLYTKYLMDTGVTPPIGSPAADAAGAEERALAGGSGGGGARMTPPRQEVQTVLSKFAEEMLKENLA